ncbi:hypothetical protein ZIOFF_021754 [Zingiber officinale]|uniref:Uncharacterized protein n=1 Tax=Zingiber officinale TaxID=94328 RepID=A0A8J5HJ96_ZINOF|nr:hypothetical protein ZIOFF_021754 [Zingiber officinale]
MELQESRFYFSFFYFSFFYFFPKPVATLHLPRATLCPPRRSSLRRLLAARVSAASSPLDSPPHPCHLSLSPSPLESPAPPCRSNLHLLLATNHQLQGIPTQGNQMVASQFTSFADEPRLEEKAARFPCFGVRNIVEAGKLSRVLSSQSLMSANNGKRVTISDAIMEKPRFSGRVSYSSLLGASPMSDSLVMIGAERNGRKRKAAPKCQGKISPLSSPNMNPPKYKEMQTARGHEQNINGSRELGEDGKPFEPPKDYIHIMARRGQATDNHSLAERVAGKAIMLDEIINYVQCLQWQVEIAMEDAVYDALIYPFLYNDYGPVEAGRMVACTAACLCHAAALRPSMSQLFSFGDQNTVQSLPGSLAVDTLFQSVH